MQTTTTRTKIPPLSPTTGSFHPDDESIDSFDNDNNTSDNSDADDEKAILSDSTDSWHNLHQQNQIGHGDGQNQNDDSSLSNVDFLGVDFAPILADLELIRQNGRIR